MSAALSWTAPETWANMAPGDWQYIADLIPEIARRARAKEELPSRETFRKGAELLEWVRAAHAARSPWDGPVGTSTWRPRSTWQFPPANDQQAVNHVSDDGALYDKEAPTEWEAWQKYTSAARATTTAKTEDEDRPAFSPPRPAFVPPSWQTTPPQPSVEKRRAARWTDCGDRDAAICRQGCHLRIRAREERTNPNIPAQTLKAIRFARLQAWLSDNTGEDRAVGRKHPYKRVSRALPEKSEIRRERLDPLTTQEQFFVLSWMNARVVRRSLEKDEVQSAAWIELLDPPILTNSRGLALEIRLTRAWARAEKRIQQNNIQEVCPNSSLLDKGPESHDT